MNGGVRTGLSSGSVSAASAAELGRLTASLGGDVVDLRAGKGHRWEEDGIAAVRAEGVDVAFVGISAALGDPRSLPETLTGLVPEPGLPVKVFAAEGCTSPSRFGLTSHQIKVLTDAAGSAGRVLVETHHGYAPVPELLDLCERTGVRILLDTLGLARVDSQPLDAARQLADLTVAVQVKGFDWADPEHSRHLPLGTCEGPTRRILDVLPHVAAATVESKAGCLEGDLRALRAWLAAG